MRWLLRYHALPPVDPLCSLSDVGLTLDAVVCENSAGFPLNSLKLSLVVSMERRLAGREVRLGAVTVSVLVTITTPGKVSLLITVAPVFDDAAA